MVGLAFVAAVEPAASGGPGHVPLDNPAVAARVGGGLDAPSGQAMRDAPAAQQLPQVPVVVALVAMQPAGLATPRPPAGTDGRYAPRERLKILAVVHADTRDANGQRQTGALGDQVDLRPG